MSRPPAMNRTHFAYIILIYPVTVSDQPQPRSLTFAASERLARPALRLVNTALTTNANTLSNPEPIRESDCNHCLISLLLRTHSAVLFWRQRLPLPR